MDEEAKKKWAAEVVKRIMTFRGDQELMKFLKEIGLPYTTYSDWSKGRRFPTDHRLLQIAENLNANPEWIKYGRGARGPFPSVEDLVDVEEEIGELIAHVLPPEPWDDRSEEAAAYEAYENEAYNKAHDVTKKIQDRMVEMKTLIKDQDIYIKELETLLKDRDAHIASLEAQIEELKNPIEKYSGAGGLPTTRRRRKS